MRRSAAAVLALALGSSCSKAEPPLPPPRLAAATAVPRPIASAPASSGSRSQEADLPDPDPEASKLFLAQLDRPASPLAAIADPKGGAPPPGGPTRVTLIALENTARGEAPGMKADDELHFANLAEQQRGTTEVTLAPGSCSTFIAEGGLGVREADLFLTQGEGASVHVVAEDASRGPIAVIGGKGRCFANSQSTPLVVELHVTVRRGAGPIVVRGYRK